MITVGCIAGEPHVGVGEFPLGIPEPSLAVYTQQLEDHLIRAPLVLPLPPAGRGTCRTDWSAPDPHCCRCGPTAVPAGLVASLLSFRKFDVSPTGGG